MESSLCRNYTTGRGSPYTGKNFKCGIYVGGRLSPRVARVKKADLWLLKLLFVKFLEQTSFGMYLYVKEL